MTGGGGGALAATVSPAASPAASLSSPVPTVPPQGPAGDAFYVPPSPLPPGQPGDIIWQRVRSADTTSTTYLVLYRSTTATGAPDAVSGTIAVPKGGRLGTTPIISVAPGTAGLGDACATSKLGFIAVAWAPDFTADGYAVATTDYEGLGTPGVHTYTVGTSEGHAVLDIARAAGRLGVGLSSDAPVGLVGYSQGGGAVAWAGELAPTYAPDLHVMGIAAGGIPADMPMVARFSDGAIGFGLLAGVALGYDAAYPDLDLDSYLTSAGRAAFAAAANSCAPALLTLAGKHMSDYATTNPFTTAAWQARLAENSLGAHPPKAPVFMYQGVRDELLPFAQADALHRGYCGAGVKVSWQPYPGEHLRTLAASLSDVHRYIVDRMNGVPAPSNC
jgi:hypothetical protein